MFVVFAPNSKLNHFLHADITKKTKVIFPFGSDSCFKLMQRCHVNKLGGGGGGGGGAGGGGGTWTENHAGSPRLASPLLFSPCESSRLTNKAAPVF